MKKAEQTEIIKTIRDRDIVLAIENALNYGPPHDTLFLAALTEITELRQQIIELGGTLPMAQTLDGRPNYQKLYL